MNEEKLKAEKEALASALISMYEQYCPNGHQFMQAGEEASTVLAMQGYATFTKGGRMTLSQKPLPEEKGE